jgi:hypothetical protein
MPLPALNRRYKAGLFLVLVAAGISLFLEASAKQTAGVVLLALAATWLVGSASLRTLRFTLSTLVFSVGLFVAAYPVWSDWKSYQKSVQVYGSAIADLRAAVAKSTPGSQAFTDIPPVKPAQSTDKWEKYAEPTHSSDKWEQYVEPNVGTTPYTIEAPDKSKYTIEPPSSADNPITAQSDIFDKVAKPQGDIFDQAAAASTSAKNPTTAQFDGKNPVSGYTLVRGKDGKSYYLKGENLPDDVVRQKLAKLRGAADRYRPGLGSESLEATGAPLRRIVIIPDTVRQWEVIEGPSPQSSSGDWFADHAPEEKAFPANMSDEEIMHEFQNNILVMPWFSMWNSIKSHRATSFSGTVLVVCGMLGSGGLFWRKRRAIPEINTPTS